MFAVLACWYLFVVVESVDLVQSGATAWARDEGVGVGAAAIFIAFAVASFAAPLAWLAFRALPRLEEWRWRRIVRRSRR